MKVFTCNEFTGHWPVGSAAVVMAYTKEQAITILQSELAEHALEQIIAEDMLQEQSMSEPYALILCDGDY